jgi:hypothetical protein
VADAFADFAGTLNGAYGDIFSGSDRAAAYGSSGINGMQGGEIRRAFTNARGRAARTFGGASGYGSYTASDLGSGSSFVFGFFFSCGGRWLIILLGRLGEGCGHQCERGN